MSNIITKKEVQKVAELARIKLSEEEKEKFSGNLNDILEYFKDLAEVNTEGGVIGFDHYQMEENSFRADGVKSKKEDEKEAIRKLFPKRKDNYLKVKEVLNGSH